jgi:hypothetical protein
LHQPDIHGKQEVRLFDFSKIYYQSVRLWYWYIEILKQAYQCLLVWLQFLFEQDQNYLVQLINGLVDHMLLVVLKWLQYGRS